MALTNHRKSIFAEAARGSKHMGRLEAGLGVTLGHAEATTIVERFFNALGTRRKVKMKTPRRSTA